MGVSIGASSPNSLFSSRWLLCEPRFYDVTYEINPWMSVARTPDTTRAMQQWRLLHHTLIRLGGWVEYIDQQPGLPDMVFTANGALVRGNKAILPRYRHAERHGETEHFRRWFEEHGFEVYELSSGFFEGEGDALFWGDVLVGAYGFRTEKGVYQEIASILECDTLLVELSNPHFYHLDTCFCPLNSRQALFVASAFTSESAEALGNRGTILEITVGDAEKFACNSVVLDSTVIIPSGCEATERMLGQQGFVCYPVQLDEFLKAGGAAKCLSLKLPSLELPLQKL